MNKGSFLDVSGLSLIKDFITPEEEEEDGPPPLEEAPPGLEFEEAEEEMRTFFIVPPGEEWELFPRCTESSTK